MNCKEVQTMMVDYLDQAMDVIYGDAIKQHLAGCDQCRRESEELQELLLAMTATEMRQPGPGLRENFQLMLQSELNMETTDRLLHEGGESGGGSGRTGEGGLGQVGDRRRMGESGPGQVGKKGRMGGGGPDGGGKLRVLKAGWLGWRVAAAVVLLAGGIGIGVLLSSRKGADTPDQLAGMRKEIKEMKQMLLYSLIDDESASQRIKAVSYTEQMTNPDQKVIEVLVGTLNHDKNVNVRLAALYSLASFADNRVVRDSLVASLPRQTEPLIQVMLINLLAAKKDSRAIGPIKEIISNRNTLPAVKEAAEQSLKTL